MDVKWPLAVNFYYFSFKSVSQSVSRLDSQVISQSGEQAVS